MSRLAPLAGLGALCAAAVPTWEAWRYGIGYEWFSYCPFGVALTPLSVWDQLAQPYALPLRADATAVLWPALAWGVPVIVVLVGLVHRRSAVTGRRVAVLLTLFAVLEPLTFRYFDVDACAEVRIFSGQWFAEVVNRLGTATPVFLLVAAVLVLVVTQNPENRAGNGPAGTVARRVLAFLICYWAVAVMAGYLLPVPNYSHSGLLVWLIVVTQGLFLPWSLLVLVPALVLLEIRRRARS